MSHGALVDKWASYLYSIHMLYYTSGALNLLTFVEFFFITKPECLIRISAPFLFI